MLGELGLGLYQNFSAGKKLKALNKIALPEYGITPEQQGSFDAATKRAKFGFDPTQKANFLNNVQSSQNAAYQKAIDTSGGQMASAIGRLMQANQLRSMNQFAADDAQKQQYNQQYADSMGQNITQQRNLKTQTEIQRRMMLEQALGTAKAQGLNNIASGINSAESLAIGAATGGASLAMTGGGKKVGGGQGANPYYNPYSDPYNGIQYIP